MSGQFHGKNVLVTGAANGVGLATAQAFASEGAYVFAADIDDARGEATVRAIVDGGGTAEFVHADMASADGIAALFARILARNGRLDAAVNNAGIDLEVGAERGSWSDATMERVWRVNVMGVLHCLQHELRQMETQRFGAIVNVSSSAGRDPCERDLPQRYQDRDVPHSRRRRRRDDRSTPFAPDRGPERYRGRRDLALLGPCA